MKRKRELVEHPVVQHLLEYAKILGDWEESIEPIVNRNRVESRNKEDSNNWEDVEVDQILPPRKKRRTNFYVDSGTQTYSGFSFDFSQQTKPEHSEKLVQTKKIGKLYPPPKDNRKIQTQPIFKLSKSVKIQTHIPKIPFIIPLMARPPPPPPLPSTTKIDIEVPEKEKKTKEEEIVELTRNFQIDLLKIDPSNMELARVSIDIVSRICSIFDEVSFPSLVDLSSSDSFGDKIEQLPIEDFESSKELEIVEDLLDDSKKSHFKLQQPTDHLDSTDVGIGGEAPPDFDVFSANGLYFGDVENMDVVDNKLDDKDDEDEDVV